MLAAVSYESAVAQLGDQSEHIVELALLDAIGGTLTAEQAMWREQPQVGLLGLVELRQLPEQQRVLGGNL